MQIFALDYWEFTYFISLLSDCLSWHLVCTDKQTESLVYALEYLCQRELALPVLRLLS